MIKKRNNYGKIICLILISVVVSCSYLLAKYTSSFNSSDNKEVAKWYVESTSNDPSTLNLVSGNTTESYTLNITSMSEVSVVYSVTVSGVPSGMEVKIDSNAYQTAGNDGIITFNSVGSFTPSDVNNTYVHTLTFNSPLNSTIPSVNNVDVDVIFTQTD